MADVTAGSAPSSIAFAALRAAASAGGNNTLAVEWRAGSPGGRSIIVSKEFELKGRAGPANRPRRQYWRKKA
jgi:hypothetical protein